MIREEPAAIPYCRAVYAELLDWYKMADIKGQILLTLNGIFITLLGGVVLLSPKDLLERKLDLSWITWSLLAAGSIATVLSVISSIACLHSRLSNSKLHAHKDLFIKEESPTLEYRPAVTFWFGTLAQLDMEAGQKMLRGADPSFELEAISEEIMLLAPNVLAKHRWVNRGWLAAGIAILLVFLSVISVVVETT